MADNRRTFILRVVSAVLAASTVLLAGIFGGSLGLQIVCAAVIVLGLREFSRIAFRHWQMPQALESAYWLICTCLLLSFVYSFEYALPLFALANLLFFVAALWITRQRVNNENLLTVIAMGCFGLMYCLLFPFFTFKMTAMENGPQWFLLLLAIVFAGDTFAYFGGRWFGKHKMMPAISPNKTWQGAVAGVIGSCLAGMIQMVRVLDNVQLWKGLVFCILCAIAAQSGDLLMSLVKRVAHIKDSGHIMPGHGGILDRLDGVFMASPLIYAFALYVTRPF